MNDAEAILRGDRRALARGLSVLETDSEQAIALLDAVWPQVGRARRIGVTGPPGVGKSTLVAALMRHYRVGGGKVGVVAVDPTSALTGGALLGDRHRMAREAADDGVFVRSLASRGTLGGLSRAAPAALDLLDAAGFATLLVETVGVGQSELEVASTADSVVVVLSPESGDAVQAMKAGLLEVADVLCVNKTDRPGASELEAALESMLDRKGELLWRPPVVRTNALADAAPLEQALDAHRAWLAEGDRLATRRRAGLRARLERLVGAELAARLLERHRERIDKEADAAAAGRRSILAAAHRAVKEVLE